MIWIESHIELGDHPKMLGLMASLNVSRATAIGTLHLLWYFVMKYAWRDGDLSKYARVVIAKSCDWQDDPDVLVEALIENGFLDNGGSLKVHDWQDFAGRLVKDRLYKESKRTFGDAKSTPIGGLDAVPNLTVPNLTIKKNSRFSFSEIWDKYPNKDGKKYAERSFYGSVKTDQDWIDINAALNNYINSEKVLKGFIKNGSTWFNNWKDWVNPTSQMMATEKNDDGLTPEIRESLRKNKEINAKIASCNR
jgi:hypothetical protein